MTVRNVEPGSTVMFRLSSAVCPETEQIREKITSNLEVRGRVVFLSDGGNRKGHYAVVEVGGIVSPMVVPVELVQQCQNTNDDQNELIG